METNKKILLSIFLGFFLLTFGFVNADSTGSTNVTATIVSIVSISVPETLILEDISAGYVSKKRFYILNTGTTDVSVTPSLPVEYTGDIFTNLAFGKLSGDPELNINSFSLEIDKPSDFGGEKNQSFYAYLDLTNYTGSTIEENHSTQIIFTAMAA